MSADFEKVLVKDARLDVSDSIKYAVIKGGQNVTMAQYKAISATNNQIVFNIQVPSEQTIIDRRVLLQTELTLSVITSNLTTKKGCYYGIYSALASFPLHQLMTVMSATINNNTVSVNIRDVLPAMIRLIDTDDLICFNSSSPTFADTAVSYSPDACGGALPHPNSAYWGLNEPCCVVHRGAMAPIAYSGPTLQDAGSYKETFTWLLTEPLLLSPFFFANLKANNQGFYGIQNMNVVLNIGDTARVFRTLVGESASWANPSPALEEGAVINSVSNVYAGSALVGGLYFSNTQLLLNFLTPHPSDMLPARNIVPFYELPRYITPWTANVPPVTISTLSVSVPNTFVVRTQSLQLNQIPDKLIVYVRKNISQQSWGDSDTCFPISNIVVNFNNNSGILASAQQVDLYQMSRNNGLQQTWHEFKGLAVGASTTVVPSSSASSVVSVFPTVGSYLVLEFGKDIQLTEDFYAAGSLGNFNLQLNITCQNNRPYNLAVGGSYDNNVEAVLITMNSGVFVCERGTSSTYTGILTKQDVLEASQQDHYTHDDVERMVGGGFFDKIKSGFSKLASKGMEYGKKQLAKHGSRLMDKGANYLMKKGKKALAKYTAPAEEEEDE